jgi:hypothetical protein
MLKTLLERNGGYDPYLLNPKKCYFYTFGMPKGLKPKNQKTKKPKNQKQKTKNF